MLKRILLYTACMAVSLAGYAQEFKLGKVSIEELKERVHPKDTSASAAVLFKKTMRYFEPVGNDFDLVTETQYRIKIYKKSGYDYAKDQTGFRTRGSSYADYSDAYTYNLVNGQIEKTKLSSDGQFTEKVNDTYSLKKIMMPNVKEGSIIEYRIKTKQGSYGVIPDFAFQYSIPVNVVEYQWIVPEYFTYNTYMSGYVPITKSVPERRRGPNNMYSEVVTIFKGKDVPAIKDEDYVSNIRNYMSILKMELSMVKIPNQMVETISVDWPSLISAIYAHKDFGTELKLKSYFEQDVTPLLAGAASNTDRINIIFKYVQERMKWDEYNGYLCDKGVKKAYNEKSGNTAEINLMLVAMLRNAGLSANPVLVSTRANGIALYPNHSAYNYVIAAVENDNKIVLLDATSKYTVPGVLPRRAINWVGRMIRPDGSSAEVELTPKAAAKEAISVSAALDASGKVTGKMREQYYDNFAHNFRENFSEVSKESYLEGIEKQFSGIAINDYKAENTKDLSKPVMEEYSFEHASVADVVGDKIFFNPLLFLADDENPFKQEKREYPVDFTYPRQVRYNVSITLPEGYTVESLPKPAVLKMEDEIGTFKYNLQTAGKQLQLIAVYEINHAMVPQSYYPTLKDFFGKMVEKQQEKVVLKKI